MTGELLHYEEHPVVLDRTRTYPQERPLGRKPSGLWVSVSGEDDWEWWCRSEEFHLSGLEHAHRVTLRDDADVLWLTTPDQIVEFHQAWSHETEYERDFYRAYSHRSYFSDEYARNQWPIDWAKVAAQWAGIIIAPYQWSLRYGGPFWYYGMDAASGCIWDLTAIDTFEHITHEEVARLRGVEQK